MRDGTNWRIILSVQGEFLDLLEFGDTVRSGVSILLQSQVRTIREILVRATFVVPVTGHLPKGHHLCGLDMVVK